ncbi:hypothetical protein E4U09_003159 [Claviceps aff. purpurea]|uniref:Uncharacterized protein n=1 Tax=Claviceps aff. purpurea TaxID=1967640 RepID=A0A9P7QGU1_9HYPO|nr:hypothetical protein E4U09_003159 [Claviceps aff. purpurea]
MALEDAKKARDRSAWQDPTGVGIITNHVVSLGTYEGGFFYTRKQYKLSAVQLPPLNIWDRDIALMTERKWVNKYVRPQHEANAHQPIPYELGRAWTKKAGLDRIEYHSDTSPRTVYDLFGPHNEYGLRSSRGFLEIWLNFQIEETDPKRGRQPRTPTSAQHTKVAASCERSRPNSLKW